MRTYCSLCNTEGGHMPGCDAKGRPRRERKIGAVTKDHYWIERESEYEQPETTATRRTQQRPVR